MLRQYSRLQTYNLGVCPFCLSPGYGEGGIKPPELRSKRVEPEVFSDARRKEADEYSEDGDEEPFVFPQRVPAPAPADALETRAAQPLLLTPVATAEGRAAPPAPLSPAAASGGRATFATVASINKGFGCGEIGGSGFSYFQVLAGGRLDYIPAKDVQ